MTKDKVDLICDVADLAALFEETGSLEEFLEQIVGLVADHMSASVCSVYLYDEGAGYLVLRATKGLNEQLVGSLLLKLGEGIVGTALLQLRPLREGRAQESPHFKLIPGLQEERYAAMLAVPIVRGATRVGVLVVQHEQPEYFTEHDSKALRAIAVQLAATLENIRLLLALRRMQVQPSAEPPSVAAPHVIRGTPGTGGVALGETIAIGRLSDSVLFSEPADAAGLTAANLDRAFGTTERQLTELQRRIETEEADLAASFIFGAHLLMLKDEGFLGRIVALIDQGIAPTQALNAVVNEYVQGFASSPDPVFQEKAQDVKDLGYRLLRNLRGAKTESVDYSGRVIVAADLFPSDILRFAAQGAEGIVLHAGGSTAHVAVLARSVRMPMVIVNDERVLAFPDGMPIIVDAEQGSIYPNPSEQRWAEYQARARVAPVSVLSRPVLPRETRTRDGVRVHLLATLNLLRELRIARRFKAEGVGLSLTEFPFLMRNSAPSEEEQYRIYHTVTDAMRGAVVTFRTLDVGGDKLLEYYPHRSEANPFLGLRAIRFTLRHREMFAHQLRALLRSGEGVRLRIMFPLVSSVDDYLQAKELLEQVRGRLARECIAHCHQPEIGAMIELPSAVELIDELAEVADFLSIGTNDLIQYLLAVDRTNAQVSHLYLPHHPAVLRALKRIAEAAARRGTEVSVCGELGGDERLLPFLIGIGIRTLSVDPESIPRVQARIARIDTEEASALANELVRLGRISEVAARLQQAGG